jgi:protein-disulfide isomerase
MPENNRKTNHSTSPIQPVPRSEWMGAAYFLLGKAALIYKQTVFLGPESSWAAVAAECAADQDRFGDFHNLLFSRQNGENQGAFNKGKLLAWAAELKLDMARFEPLLTETQ